MQQQPDKLAARLEAVVGAANVTAKPALRIDGLEPAFEVRPANAAEAAAVLAVCAEAGAPVAPTGFSTWMDGGNPLHRVEVVLSTARMNRIIEYSPADLIAIVEAGVALSEMNETARRENQWLPFDPPGAQRATLGAIAACATQGALRSAFGMPRDYVIGLKLAHADGTESRSGGRVVKNVAGYDLNKLYVGSFGTLAVLTELIFKLRPLPERFATVAITATDRAALLELASRAMNGEARPAAVFLVEGADLPLPNGSMALLVRLIESHTAVAHQLEWLSRHTGGLRTGIIEGEREADLWRAINDLHQIADCTVRARLPLSRVAAAYEKWIAAPPIRAASVDFGAGILRMAFDEGDAATQAILHYRQEAASFGGTLFVERASTETRGRAGAWDDPGATAELMRRLKTNFDPRGLLNPGRFVAGI